MTKKYFELWNTPRDYMGEDYDGFYVTFTQNRDTNLMNRVNFEVAKEELLSLATEQPTPSGDEDVMVVRFSHWAVGWVEYILIYKTNQRAIDLAEDLANDIEMNGFLDESRYSTLLWDEIADYWKSCSDKEKKSYCEQAGVSFSEKMPDEVWDLLYETWE